MDAPPAAPVASSVDEVIDLFGRWADQRYDEELSQLDHALQTAALATGAGADDALVAAALLHDVGHLLELDAADGHWRPAAQDLRHEASGARYLAGVFGPAVTAPIAMHVQAKRYRCAVDPTYHAGLSRGSVRSLELQGGPAAAHEIERFEAHPSADAAIALRGWDDRGKVEGLPVAPLSRYRALLDRLAIR